MDQNHLCYRYTTGQEFKYVGRAPVRRRERWERVHSRYPRGPAPVQTAIQHGSSTFPAFLAKRPSLSTNAPFKRRNNRKADSTDVKQTLVYPLRWHSHAQHLLVDPTSIHPGATHPHAGTEEGATARF